ncbi:MAG: LysR family transcriptional regulator [Acidimicrobiales bacterium]
MDLRQLQALVAIADRGSFTAAAQAIHTVQSNVSAHISRLERELGVQLVDRHSGALTEEGLAVLERARRIGAEVDAVVSDVAALRDEVAGTVRMGMIGTTARWVAPLLIDRLGEKHPRVKLVVGDGTSASLEPQLASGFLDAAVVNLPLANTELVATPLFDEDLVLVVAESHPLANGEEVTLADLDGLAMLLPAGGTAFRDELDAAAMAAGISLRPRAELDGVRLMASLALRGYGPAILPATGTAEALEGLKVVRVQGLPRRKVGLAQRRRGLPSAPARATVEVLTELVAANLDPEAGLHAPRARALR